MLVWPALLNGYPVLFSDTGAFLAQTLRPMMIWDKPYVYGPFLHLFHWRVTLWAPLVAQGLILSHLLWLTQRVWRGGASPGWHLALAAGLAALTTAPWTAATLMPDVFTPVTVLSLALLGLRWERLSRGESWYLGALAALAIAVHLAHLVVAAAVVATVWLVSGLRLRPVLRGAAPLGAALAVLVATNAVGHGRMAVSPFGATFLLARLQADGPAARVVRELCPGVGWYLCAFADRLPMDSDRFLWDGDSPLQRDPEGRPVYSGGMRIAPEARAIIGETLARRPFEVARAMLRNTLVQLVTVRVGDTLVSAHLQDATRAGIHANFPAAEAAAFESGLQMRRALLARAAPFLVPHLPVLALSVPLFALAVWRAARGRAALRLGLLLCVLAGVLANAFATGALSKPHHRYQARIAWLLPFAAALALLPAAAGRAGGTAPDRRRGQEKGSHPTEYDVH
jgi:hypothetical protein